MLLVSNLLKMKTKYRNSIGSQKLSVPHTTMDDAFVDVVKVVVMGDSGVGKTHLINRCCNLDLHEGQQGT